MFVCLYINTKSSVWISINKYESIRQRQVYHYIRCSDMYVLTVCIFDFNILNGWISHVLMFVPQLFLSCLLYTQSENNICYIGHFSLRREWRKEASQLIINHKIKASNVGVFVHIFINAFLMSLWKISWLINECSKHEYNIYFYFVIVLRFLLKEISIECFNID